MLIWVKIAFRNLLNNRRRSFFTISAIAFGFAAINLLGGFTDYVFKGLEESYVYAYGNGHLSVFKQGFLTEGALDPTRYLLEEKELQALQEICDSDPRIVITTPQLNISGLVSNGQISTIMVADGRVSEDTRTIRRQGKGFVGKLKMFTGQELDDSSGYGVGMTKGLAEKMGLTLDSAVIVMAATVDGYMNALDAEVAQLIDAPMEILDDMLMTVPLNLAQDLYDTSSVDRLNILLTDSALTEKLKRELADKFASSNLGVEVMSWDQLRSSYLRIRNMFNVIFSFVFIIVLIIVALSVVNTISMAVLERTREIGTLRALGMKRRGVSVMFAIEGVMLAIAGSVAGTFLTLLGWLSIVVFQPTWIPPNIPKQVPLEIHLVPWCMALSVLTLVVLAAVAAMAPARRAARASIVDALGHI